MSTANMREDPRIDSRIKALMGGMDFSAASDVASREELLINANMPESLAMQEGMKAFMELCDTEEIAPS